MKIKTTIEVEFECDLTEESLKRKIKIWMTKKRNYPIKVDIKSILTEIEGTYENTVLFWLKKLPEPYLSEALKYVREDRRHINCTSFYRAIDKAFTWSDTPQGHGYWSELGRKLENNIPLEPVEGPVEEPRKTRLEYFNEFPRFYKQRAIDNTPIGNFHMTAEDASHAIRGAFIFSSSPEGDTFWQQFSNTLLPDYIPESKSYKAWLELLPNPYRQEALSKEINEGEANSLKDAIACAFNWDDTIEGHRYWSDLFDSLNESE
jgi:hypothetical protein